MQENEKLEAFEVKLLEAATKLFMLTDAEDYLLVMSTSFERLAGSKYFIEQDAKDRTRLASDYNAIMSFFNEMKTIQGEWQKYRDTVVTSH